MSLISGCFPPLPVSNVFALLLLILSGFLERLKIFLWSLSVLQLYLDTLFLAKEAKSIALFQYRIAQNRNIEVLGTGKFQYQVMS